MCPFLKKSLPTSRLYINNELVTRNQNLKNVTYALIHIMHSNTLHTSISIAKTRIHKNQKTPTDQSSHPPKPSHWIRDRLITFRQQRLAFRKRRHFQKPKNTYLGSYVPGRQYPPPRCDRCEFFARFTRFFRVFFSRYRARTRGSFSFSFYYYALIRSLSFCVSKMPSERRRLANARILIRRSEEKIRPK